MAKICAYLFFVHTSSLPTFICRFFVNTNSLRRHQHDEPSPACPNLNTTSLSSKSCLLRLRRFVAPSLHCTSHPLIVFLLSHRHWTHTCYRARGCRLPTTCRPITHALPLSNRGPSHSNFHLQCLVLYKTRVIASISSTTVFSGYSPEKTRTAVRVTSLKFHFTRGFPHQRHCRTWQSQLASRGWSSSLCTIDDWKCGSRAPHTFI